MCKNAFATFYTHLFLFQRKKSLLLEYKFKDKSNKFVDRRIGEKNRAMTADDRVIARFTASRVKAQKVCIIVNYIIIITTIIIYYTLLYYF